MNHYHKLNCWFHSMLCYCNCTVQKILFANVCFYSKKSFRIFFELCALCISIFQDLRNRLHQTIFQNSTGDTIFRADFDFRLNGIKSRPKSKYARKSAFPAEFWKMVWCNGFLRFWRMLIQRAHSWKIFRQLFYDPFNSIISKWIIR